MTTQAIAGAIRADILTGDDIDAHLYDGSMHCDCGRVFSGKKIEPVKTDGAGNLIHQQTGKPVPAVLSVFSVCNSRTPDRLVGMPVYFTGRACWAFSGRGYAYECYIDGQYGWLSHFMPAKP